MDTSVIVSAIVAMSSNRVIGRNGEIPWKLKSDLKRFKELTTGHTLIVGRKTYESIIRRNNGPLKNRTTIVVSRQKNFPAQECVVANSFDAALELAKKTEKEEIFIIGGTEIYRLAIPYVKKIYLTKVQVTCTGDTYFPSEFNEDKWESIFFEPQFRDENNQYASTFMIMVPDSERSL